MGRKKLKEARESRGWSQDQVAEMVGVMRRETVSDWERGIKDPYRRNIEHLCHLFGKTAAELDLAEVEEERSSTQGSTSGGRLWVPHVPTLQDFVASNMTRHLLQIAHTDYDTPDEMTTSIQAALKEFNRVNRENPTYEITRREALCELASLPWIALGRNQTLHARRYDEMLRHCTAALEACWQLYRGSDEIGDKHAFGCACAYVPLLETVAHDSNQHRKDALSLAAQYAILRTMLSWKCLTRMESVSYALEALSLSHETGNILLQFSAYSKLSYTYLTSRQFPMAWRTMREGERLLKRYQRAKKPPLPPGIVGNFYSGYAQAQIHNGIVPDRALSIATDSEPLQEHIAFTEFTASSQWWEAAWTYSMKGDPKQAMKWLKKLIDIETLAPCPSLGQSEYEQIETLNVLTQTLLQSEERDMTKIIETWTRAVEWAKVHKREVLFEEAITNFAAMRALWPGERAIMKLIPLTAHWEDEKRRGML